jgi:ArsR family transcriptional regulator
VGSLAQPASPPAAKHGKKATHPCVFFDAPIWRFTAIHRSSPAECCGVHDAMSRVVGLACMAVSGYTHITMSSSKLDVRPVSRLFKALGDEARLRMIALLSHGELCVCHIQDALDLPQPTVSRQLSILRAAGLVEHRREGTWVYYRLLAQEDPDRERLFRGLVQGFVKRGVLRRDVQRLRNARGPRSCK